MVCILFFFSGFASLILEIVFSRQLTRILGSGMSANACVFAAFMAGCALGAYLSVRERSILDWIGGHSVHSSNLKKYGRLELLCGIFSVLLFLLLNSPASETISSLVGLIAFQIPVFTDACRFAICYFLLLVPCACMGATYGVISQAFEESSLTKTELSFPFFYGINTLGAAAGVLAGGFLLLPNLGLQSTSLIACGIYGLIFAYCEFTNAAKHTKEAENETIDVSAPSKAEKQYFSRTARLWLSIAFLGGFLALFLEIVWTRIFSLLLGGSIYSLSIVLIVVLAAMAVVSLIVSLAKPNSRLTQILIAACLMDAALCLLLNTTMSKYLIWSFFSVSSHIAPRIIGDPFWQAIVTRAMVAAVFIFPAAFFLGAILPLTCRLYQDKNSGNLLYTANCIGSVLAGLVFVAFLYPGLSTLNGSFMMSTLIFSATISSTAAAILFFKIAKSSTQFRKLLFTTASVGCLLIPCSMLVHKPEWRSSIMSAGSLVYKRSGELTTQNDVQGASNDFEPLQFYKEGLNSTVSVMLNEANNALVFANDGKTEATLPIDPSLISPGSDHSTHILLAVLPTLMHKGRVSDALLIGAGSGMSASAFLSFPDLGKLTIAELEPAVVNACRAFSQHNGGAFSKEMLASGRIEIKPFDARFILSSSKKKYDVIASQPADPWVTGAADLFTVDFWRLAVARLNRSGVFCQWLQLYAIPQRDLLSLIKSFQTVFPNTVLFHPPGAGELLLIGFTDDTEPSAQLAEIESKLASNYSWFEAVAGISDQYDCLALSIAEQAQIKELCSDPEIHLCTDDFTSAEYSTAQRMLTANNEVDQNLDFLKNALTKMLIANSLTPADTSNLARACARQSIQDGTALKALNVDRAIALSDRASRESKRPLILWQQQLILRALQKKKIETVGQSGLVDDADYIALFDQAFEQHKLSECTDILNKCTDTTRKTFQWRLRHAFLLAQKTESFQAEKEFIALLLERQNSLSALLGASYASLKTKNLVNARMCLTRYLSINPWDHSSQSLLALLLVGDELAVDHARNAAQLKPGDASAFIPLLANSSNSSPEIFAKVLQIASKLAPSSTDLALVDRITKNGIEPRNLLQNADFNQLVKEIQSKVEDANSGYKILGEP